MNAEESCPDGAVFPSGLEQPEGSFRFSGDALLLADFSVSLALPENAFFADLGTGCGVVALAALRKRPLWRGVGLEVQPELAAAAARNAERLGLSERFRALEGNVVSSVSLRAARSAFSGEKGKKESQSLPLFDAVLCNPPWRREGTGRVPPSPLRRTALFGTERTFFDFFSAADAVLKSGGCLAAVSGAERTAELLAALPARLHPERLRFVFTRPDAPATFVLLMARKNGRSSLCVDRLDSLA